MSVRIVAISGSLQQSSSNTALLRLAASVAPDGVTIDIYDGVRALPHFDPDLDGPEPPAPIAELRALLTAADAVLFSTPEYAHALPGALKDMLDWLVGSGELVDKPVAVMSASPGLDGGKIAGDALVNLLEVMSASVVAQLAVGATRSKRNEHGGFTDDDTVAAVTDLVRTLADAGRTAVSDQAST
ncbi:MAG: NAD(P)H-dependent oxidoreductase [Acidimicrobiia bacterium]